MIQYVSKERSAPLAADTFITALHLDCGRNYFSPTQIKNLVDEMEKDGYQYLELAVGNDGLRFLLDDMEVCAGGKTYSSADMTEAVKAGNREYRDNGVNELTQAEMDEIIAYALEKGIFILPLVNAPGHMNTLCSVMESFGVAGAKYSDDPRTMDVTCAESVAFVTAVMQKYIDYFAGKGCKIFNLGADEYANTAFPSGSMGFGHLISENEYRYYVAFVNSVAAQIQNAGMTAVAFNDGIYYAENSDGGVFDKDLLVSYWSTGWDGYTPASASFIAQQGHTILNTNEIWYYVVGRPEGNFTKEKAMDGVTNVKVTTVPGGEAVESCGAMMCVWYDESAEYEEDIVLSLMAAQAKANPDYFGA